MYPTHKLVALGWIQTLGLDAEVGLDLPADPTTWSDNGFILVAGPVGGSPGRHVPMRNPVVQIEFWANRPNSELAPWNKAGSLAEQVIDATYRDDTAQWLVSLPSGYRPVFLHAVYPLSEPNELPGDDAGYARVVVDFALHWTEGAG